MADLETTNDQESLSAEEQAQMNEMETADSKPEVAAPTAPVKPAKPAKTSAPKADAPKAGELPVEGAEGAEGDADKGGKGKGGPLSPEALAAVREERAEKKELRDAMAKMATDHKAAMDKAAERFETVLKTFAPKVEAPKEAALPNRDEDPVGYVEAVMKKTGETLEQITKRLDAEDVSKAQNAEQEQNKQVVNGIIDQASVKEKEFLTQTPDYWDASKFLLKSRHEELEEMGYTEPQRNAIIWQEKVNIAAQALAQGKNPAAVVYGIAKRRGYTPKAAGEGAEAEGEGEGAAVVETTEQKTAAAAAKLKALGDGQEASASLSQLGGKGPSNLTAARLLEMTDAEFAAAMGTKEGRALMGQ